VTYKLVCAVPFENYEKGDEVTDPEEIARLIGEDCIEVNFVWVEVPE
jgi:hypothetical protein